jgi:hypothetical protein
MTIQGFATIIHIHELPLDMCEISNKQQTQLHTDGAVMMVLENLLACS